MRLILEASSDVGFDFGALGIRKRGDLRQQVAEAVVDVNIQLLDGRRVLVEHVLEVDGDGMAEQDGVGNLHHRGLEVQRQQHVGLFLRLFDLLCEKFAQCAAAHRRRVDHLTRLQRGLFLQHRGLAVRADELDAYRARFGNGDRFFAAVEITGCHVRDVCLGVGSPFTHAVRMLARKIFHRQSRAAVGIAFAQHGVDGAAEYLAEAGLEFFFGIVLWIFRKVRNLVTLRLQFLDRGFQLRNRGADVGQFDDVCFRLQRQFAQPGQVVIKFLAIGQILGKVGDDAASQGNISGFDINASGLGEGLNDGQQRVRCQRRRLIDFCPINFCSSHGISSSN